MLQSIRPLTWAMAGDANLAGPTRTARACPLIDRVAEAIRSSAARRQDQILDVLRPETTAIRLRNRWETQVLSLHPDLVVLFFGHSDAEASLRGFSRFEDAVAEMLAEGARLQIPVVVNTPPCLMESDERKLADRLIYLEALRALAKSFDAVLVDHWEHWETAASQTSDMQSWSAAEGKHPETHGYLEMADLFRHVLGLHSPPCTPTASVAATILR